MHLIRLNTTSLVQIAQRAVTLGLVWLVANTAAATAAPSADVRIKDITNVEGVRVNQLVGLGLVTGLNGTGGKSPVTRQFAQNMLQRFGLRADPQLRLAVRNDAKQKTDNLSVVTVMAELPIFAKPGSRIDITVSAFDDASSLQGGTLMMTPLLGVDKHVYALASGAVSIGGFSFSGDAASVQKNHPTTGRIPNGAIVEEEIPTSFGQQRFIRLLLNQPDFETARRMSEVINQSFADSATAVDAGTIHIDVPESIHRNLSEFIGMVGSLRVAPDVKARVVINERTGTVVMGEYVRLSKVAITHANLSVITGETPQVSQPLPRSRGKTKVVPRTEIDVFEESQPVHVFEESITVGDLASALNALGVTPRDLSSIFQQLKASGALHADLEFK